MKKLGLVAAAAIAASTIALAPTALGAEGLCDDGGSGLGTGQHAIGPGGAGTIWIDNRDYATGNGLWIYLESNDRPNSLERRRQPDW